MQSTLNLKPRVQHLEEMVTYRFRMQSYYFEMMRYEQRMKERAELELHVARGGPPRSIPDPPEVPQKPFRPSEYVEDLSQFPIWEVQLTP